jgi:hypothetical protein
LNEVDWTRVQDAKAVLQDANDIQQYFSSERQATLWRAIPAVEQLQTQWEAKRNSPKYSVFRDALQKGLDKLGKYYNKFDEKPVYVLALGINFLYLSLNTLINYEIVYTVLHPYYKLAYIKMAWGGAEEQAAECAAGNLNAKNWQDEALKVVERTMESYWKARRAANGAASAVDANVMIDDNCDLETDFDRHRKALFTQVQMSDHGRWEAELRRYLKDIPDRVSKDTDVIDWWGVCTFTNT